MEMNELTIEIPKSQIQERNNRLGFEIFFFILNFYAIGRSIIRLTPLFLGRVLDFFHFLIRNSIMNFNY